MEFDDLRNERRSIRKFTDDPVSMEDEKHIIEAVISAPSAGNLQAFSVVVVRSEQKRQELAQAAFGQRFVGEAPLVLVFLADKAKAASKYGARGDLYSVQDATIACTFAHLAAADIGLGSVWIGAFDDDLVAKAVDAGGLRPVAMLPIGHPAQSPDPRSRDNAVIREGHL